MRPARSRGEGPVRTDSTPLGPGRDGGRAGVSEPLRRRVAGRRPSDWPRRLRRHAILGLASLFLTTALFLALRSGDSLFRLSMASAYAGLALLGATLLIGPWNILAGRPNPVSTDLRRDLGIWATLLGFVHVVVGLQVHMGGRFWQYFFYGSGPDLRQLRRDPFGFANWAGLVVTLLLLLLLALSNDASLRRLGRRRWKAFQRLNYAGFVLVVAHGALYQLIEKRSLRLVGLFGAMVLVVAIGQAVGFRRVRTRASRAGDGR